MPAGIGASGYLAVTHETSPGTYLPPSTAGTIFVPILSEDLKYTEDKYYSEAIRQQTIDNDVKSSYYHVEGDITWEVDCKFLPYFLYCARLTPAKTGAGPYVYSFVPASTGSAPLAGDTVTGVTNRRTASFSVIRNGIGFGYGGCVLGGYSFVIENGVLRMTMNIVGLSETDPSGNGTPTWQASALLGADTHQVYVATSAVTPTFTTNSTDFDGFTFTANDNPEPQNRIRADRQASYIAYGKTEATVETELDFVSKTEYTAFKNATQKAIKLESVQGAPATTYATATDNAVQLQINRAAYDTYDVSLGDMSSITKAGVNMHVLGIAGGNPFAIGVKSSASIL